MLNAALETVEAIPDSATRMETRRAQMKAGFQLLASDRMEGKGPIETKSSRSSCDSLMENSNRLLVMQSVHKYLKAASESEASLDDVIVELRDELADALECFSSF